MNKEAQLKSILETITRVNNFDFSQEALVLENNSELDLIAQNLNEIAQKLQHKIKNKEFLDKQLNYTQEIANSGSWVLDFETNKMIWSKEAFKIFGKQAHLEEVPFETFMDAVHPGDREVVNEAYQKSILEEEDNCEVEHRVVSEQWEEIKFVIEKCKYERDNEGKVLRSIGYVKDITENKKVRELNTANLSELNFYKYALDKASIVAITNHKGVIIHVNDNFCKISKYSREELLGNDHRIVNSKFHKKEFFKDMWQTISSGKIWKGEIQNKDKYGQFYWVDTVIIPFLDELGTPQQYLSIRTDITSRKRSEEILLRSHETLEEKVLERTEQLTSVIENLKENKLLLRKSEYFNKGILNSLTSHIAVVNFEGEIIAVNEAWNKFALSNEIIFLNQTGVGANYYKACEQAIANGDTLAQTILTGLKEVMERKVEHFQIEYPCHSPKQERWFLMRVMKFESEDPMIVISHTDITTRKLAEQKITFHSNLLLAVEQSVIATDFTGKIIYWNKAAETIYGWTEEETLGKSIADIMLSDQTMEEGMAVLEILMAGKSWSGELTVQRKNGEHFKIWISHSILTNELSEPIGIIGVSIDITESVKAKEELLKSNERYDLVAKATHDSIWELDIKLGKVMRLGDGFEILFGYKKEHQNNEELNYYNLVHPDDIAALKESEELAFNDCSVQNWEHNYRFLKANGEYAFVHDRGFILRDEYGKAYKMIGATQDITEVVKHTKAIEEQNRKLREIAWIQSHVVRAPLARMMGIVSILEDEELSSESFKTWVGHFVKSSQELDCIIKDIILKANAIDLSVS
ncbi:MAG: PAS domain S-box protein [Bacteroidia bacterium]|nr:PAS domain S-box protein [Bacteroidia bacterium]MCF8427826.1 PAS domain S-box protein [Bacteroidia bacterium]